MSNEDEIRFNFSYDKNIQKTICEVLGLDPEIVQEILLTADRAHVKFRPSNEEVRAGILSVTVERHIRSVGDANKRRS